MGDLGAVVRVGGGREWVRGRWRVVVRRRRRGRSIFGRWLVGGGSRDRYREA